MKKSVPIFLLALGATVGLQGQEFTNLDFEQAQVTGERSYPWEQAAPGWSHSDGSDTARIFHESGHLGATQMFSLYDTPGTHGAYAFRLQSGFNASNDPERFWVEAFIAQTGRIPENATTIELRSTGPLKIMIDGRAIPVRPVGNDHWVGYVAPFAGEIVELKLQTPDNTILDDITFSSPPVWNLLWRNNSGGMSRSLIGPGSFQLRTNVPNRLGPKWRAIAEADFDRDGQDDILFQNPAGALQVQLMQGNVVELAVLIRDGKVPGKGWKPVAAADFNRDDFADLLFQHGDGRLAIWWLKGGSFVGSEDINIPEAKILKALAADDLNGDGETDILFQGKARQLSVAYGPGFTETTQVDRSLPPGWFFGGLTATTASPSAANALLLQHGNGKLSAWLFEEGQVTSTGKLEAGVNAGAWRLINRR